MKSLVVLIVIHVICSQCLIRIIIIFGDVGKLWLWLWLLVLLNKLLQNIINLHVLRVLWGLILCTELVSEIAHRLLREAHSLVWDERLLPIHLIIHMWRQCLIGHVLSIFVEIQVFKLVLKLLHLVGFHVKLAHHLLVWVEWLSALLELRGLLVLLIIISLKCITFWLKLLGARVHLN